MSSLQRPETKIPACAPAVLSFPPPLSPALQNHLWNESKDRLKNALSPTGSPPGSPSSSFERERSGSPPAKTVRLGKDATCNSEFSEDEEEEEEEEERRERGGGESGPGRNLGTLIRA